MKVFTKLGMAFLMAIWASGMLWAQNSAMEIAPNANNTPYASEVIFDLQFDYAVGVGGGEAGIETDGNYIYTSMWNGAGEFQRYGMDGTWMETITVAGSNGCRDIAYDGTYFYGGAASTTIFEMDLANATMVSTFTGPAACRAIAYNEDDDAFYCNNWSDDITKFDKAGANLGSFAIGASAASYYGMAYQGSAYCGDGPFLWGYSQTGATQNELIQMDLPSGTETGLTFDVGSVANVGAGIAGGLAIAENMVAGYWTILGTSQNEDIWGVELCSAGPLPSNDVGISAIVSPVSGSGLTSTETVTVTVKNFGTTTQSSIPVSFTVDGGAAVNETVSTTLNQGETFDYTFTATADLSGLGDHTIDACTALAGDENAANDCNSATVSNLTQVMAYPQSADDWTGTCTVTAKTDVSFVRAYGGDGTTNEQGWMMFDVSGVPAGSTINWIKFHGYVANTNWPYWSITPMPIDPLTATAADIFNTASAGSGTDVAYSYNNEGSTFAQGWYEYTLGNTANADLAAALAQGWFAVGIFERDGSDTYFLELDGWNETNVPYLEIDYSAASTVGSLDGTVTDAATTLPIDGATVTVAGLSATTGADGTYMIDNVPTGSQSVECSATGYTTDNATVTIVEGATTTQDFALNAGSTLVPPFDLTADVNNADVTLNWAAPGSGSGQWIQWDAGVNNGNAIGLTNGGTFYTASHWTPADLAPYDGQSISKMSFFPNADSAATFVLMAWTGPAAGTVLMTQNVTSYTVDEFNEVDLNNNILIDASTDLWFGYSVTHDAGTFPAGTDDGPAIAYSGDMLSLDGSSWVSMSTDFGLDYNWNIAAFVLDSKSSNPIAQPMSKLPQTQFVPQSLSSAASAGLNGAFSKKFVPNSVKALLGYNVYRDGGMLDYTTATTYLDADLDPGTYDYYVTAVYDEGESDPSNTVSATVDGSSAVVIFEDDFEAYNAGEQVACQNPDDWTTWSNLPCDATEDAYISDAYAYSGSNSVVIVENNDLVKNLDTYYTSGVFDQSMMVYVPSGFDGYYNVLSDFDGAYEWGLEVYFNVGGDGSLNAGATGAATFVFNFDTWMNCHLHLDLDNDWAQYYIDDVLIYEWQWTLGAAGGGSQLQLAAFDFFGATATTQMYFDDFMLDGAPGQFAPPENVVATADGNVVTVTWDPPSSGTPDGYNVFRDGSNVGYVTASPFTDPGLANGTYEYCVSAVYGTNESSQSCASVTVNVAPPPGPTNLAGPSEVQVNEDIVLTWDVPGNNWIQWDAGVNNGNAIGLTDGGSFDCAAHWTPAQLNDIAGLSLTQMSFFPNGDPNATFVLKVWTGPNGDVEVMNQTVTSYTVDEFNEVVLDNPVVIDGSTDLWIGYTVTHDAGSFPAGTDDGPAVAYSGDMISTGGGWVSMSTDFNLNYNWNIAGYVEFVDGKSASLGEVVALSNSNSSLAASGSTGQTVKFTPPAMKDFLNFNVYRKLNSTGTYAVIGTSVDPTYTDNVAAAGSYYYQVTAVWDAGESDPSNTINVDVLLGVDEVLANSTKVFPNPATDLVNVNSDFTIESITVYNHAGQIVVNQEVNSKLYQVNTSQYQSGVYFIQINTKEGQISKRVIIK